MCTSVKCSISSSGRDRDLGLTISQKKTEIMYQKPSQAKDKAPQISNEIN